MLSGYLKQIIARREACGTQTDAMVSSLVFSNNGDTPIKEVSEIIVLPEFNKNAAVGQDIVDSIRLSDAVSDELFRYIQKIASLYNHNPCKQQHLYIRPYAASHHFACQSTILSMRGTPNPIHTCM